MPYLTPHTSHLTPHNKRQEIILMLLMSILCFAFSVFRVFYSESKLFLFLNWNLFLAFIPWLLSTLVIIKPTLQNNKITLWVLLFTWILFFPNAPYILTDLFHLRGKSAMPLWFDLVLILSFAWTGLLFGFLSLWNIDNLLKKTFSKNTVIAIIIGLLFLSSFGIYLGRYLRWNSWDIMTRPFALLYDVADRFINPFAHPRTWGVTLFMGIFLNMMYWSFRLMKNQEQK